MYVQNHFGTGRRFDVHGTSTSNRVVVEFPPPPHGGHGIYWGLKDGRATLLGLSSSLRLRIGLITVYWLLRYAQLSICALKSFVFSGLALFTSLRWDFALLCSILRIMPCFGDLVRYFLEICLL